MSRHTENHSAKKSELIVSCNQLLDERGYVRGPFRDYLTGYQRKVMMPNFGIVEMSNYSVQEEMYLTDHYQTGLQFFFLWQNTMECGVDEIYPKGFIESNNLRACHGQLLAKPGTLHIKLEPGRQVVMLRIWLDTQNLAKHFGYGFEEISGIWGKLVPIYNTRFLPLEVEVTELRDITRVAQELNSTVNGSRELDSSLLQGTWPILKQVLADIIQRQSMIANRFLFVPATHSMPHKMTTRGIEKPH